MNRMTNEPLVAERLHEGVLTLTLGRMPAHPLSRDMIRALHEAFGRAVENGSVEVIILHGPGHIFCAGHDLKEVARHRADPDEGRAYVEDLFAACCALMLDVATCPKPTIAMVEGIATAAGLQLMASCDLAYAAPEASFCLPGVQNGGFCTTPSVPVSRLIGQKQVMEMTLSGATYDAEWALANGLINRVIPASELAEFVESFARKLATRNQNAVRSGKTALRQQLELPLNEAYALATPVMVEQFMDPARRHLDWKP
ncbi:enoyl-CoA hydratase-related protein [Primorskyibacter sp. S87]|uniref:enoyl-CoA hydratase-related protein n=1 Tax=Primorskyibacter sp. S87 TaxID=3415126 RepID=UPI003C7ECDD7